MNISIIAAISKNYILSIDNKIPWSLFDDMLWFKSKTLNKPVIMGRKTFEYIGRELPLRKNIVISSNKISNSNFFVKTPTQALKLVQNFEEVMIIGGSKLYEWFLPKTKRLYLTTVDIILQGNNKFPNYLYYRWKKTYHRFYKMNINNSHNFIIEIFERY